MSSEYGIHKAVKAITWLWLSGKSLQTVLSHALAKQGIAHASQRV